jgi:DNA-binding NtrC family response regulator
MPPRNPGAGLQRNGKPLVLAATASADEGRRLSSTLKEAGFEVRCIDGAEDAEIEIGSQAGPCVLVIDSGLLEMHHDDQWRVLGTRHPGLATVVRCWIKRNPGFQRREACKFLVHPDDGESLLRAIRALAATVG